MAEALEAAERAAQGSSWAQGEALNLRGILAFSQGRFQEASGLFARAAGEAPLLRARVLLNLGVVREREGRPEEAEALYRESMREAERVGSLEALGRAWNNLGALYYRQGRKEEARAAYQQALALAKEGREWVLTAAVLANLAELQGDPASLEEAIHLLQEARYSVLAERYQRRLEAFRSR